ncbi:hypothetical protein N234_07020 [Ralstonia pickettii DTP0602]|nr:hypothetical protein N234_07020 [Ralstonia pickettii DTP0602]
MRGVREEWRKCITLEEGVGAVAGTSVAALVGARTSRSATGAMQRKRSAAQY